ncbi:arginase [Paenibacillus sp. NPDC058071]|uniref:arginase n=1 Tax=Paenibacillus sp. NPDC058071 TaxID=3346326 RepID=UPI0036DD9FDD
MSGDSHTAINVTIVHAPFGAGAGHPGSEAGPAGLARLDVSGRLRSAGCSIADIKEADLPGPGRVMPTPEAASYSFAVPAMKHAAEVFDAGRIIAPLVRRAADAGTFPLTIGGDHSIAIGTVAGLAAEGREMGVIWFDAHADLNTEDSSLTGNMHGIPLATALGLTRLQAGAISAGAGEISPMRTVLIGVREIDPAEAETIRKLGIRCFGMSDIRRLGMKAVAEQALAIAGNGANAIHLSFDIDSIDPAEAPGTGTPVAGGVSSREAKEALALFGRSSKLASADFVELNPRLDQQWRTAKLMAELIESLFK